MYQFKKFGGGIGVLGKWYDICRCKMLLRCKSSINRMNTLHLDRGYMAQSVVTKKIHTTIIKKKSFTAEQILH